MIVFAVGEYLFGIQQHFCNNAKAFTLVLAILQKKEIKFSDVYGKYICNALRSKMIRIYIFSVKNGTEYAVYQ